mgnify:CR=1 FL=1
MPAPAVGVAAAGGGAAAGGAASGGAAGATAATGASRAKKVLGASPAGLLTGGGNSTQRQEQRMDDMARNSADTGHQFGKAQQTLFGYSRPHIEQVMSPDSNTVIIASKPGGEDLPLDVQSQRHDDMHGELTELAATNPELRILSGKGRSEEWGNENSFALTNVPDHLMPLIRQMAARYKQDSILHSPVGTSDAFFTKPGGQRTAALTDPALSNEEPSDFTQFGGGNLVFGGYRDIKQASEAMDAAWRMLKQDNESNRRLSDEELVERGYVDENGFWTEAGIDYEFGASPEVHRALRLSEGYEERPHMNLSHGELNRIMMRAPFMSAEQRQAYDDEENARILENLHFPDDDENTPAEDYLRFDTEWQDLHRSEPMSVGDVLIKERKSPEAMRHKREYDKAYESTPERVKYRVDLNRERRRRGIMGSHDHMDVSHTEGGKLTLEPEHSNRARHFKEQGTLRRLAKSAKDDIELLRNLLQGPMDEQDRLIATKLAENIKEKDDSEAEMDEEDTYQHLVRPSHD